MTEQVIGQLQNLIFTLKSGAENSPSEQGDKKLELNRPA